METVSGYTLLDYVHTVSFSLAFYIFLRPQGIRKQMKTLRKRHRVHIALVFLYGSKICPNQTDQLYACMIWV